MTKGTIKMKIISTFCSMLLLVSMPSFSMDTSTIQVNANSTQFVIKLPSNPTTGFQWSVVSYDQTILKLKSSEFIAPQTKLIGAGGVMTYTFTLVSGETMPENTELEFKNARSWEPNSGMVKHITVHFNP